MSSHAAEMCAVIFRSIIRFAGAVPLLSDNPHQWSDLSEHVPSQQRRNRQGIECLVECAESRGPAVVGFNMARNLAIMLADILSLYAVSSLCALAEI